MFQCQISTIVLPRDEFHHEAFTIFIIGTLQSHCDVGYREHNTYYTIKIMVKDVLPQLVLKMGPQFKIAKYPKIKLKFVNTLNL